MLNSAPIQTSLPRISLIIPCHNALGKIGRCLASLRRIDLAPTQYEVIFVDDCSSDGTYQMLQDQCADVDHWRVIRMGANSGSPSAPRNRGVVEAQGDYIFFLDCDDEILPDTLRLHLAHAQRTGADIVRGHLIAESNGAQKVLNRIQGWSDTLSKAERISLIVGSQSTTVCNLIRTSLLRENELFWRSDLRMGEDTLFLITVLAAADRIEYIDHPTFIYVKTPSFTPSSTQSYGNRELRDHLTVWRGAAAAMHPLGIDYIALRLQIGLQTALHSMIFVNRGDITDETFHSLSVFLNEYRSQVEAFGFSRRLKDLIEIAGRNDPRAFARACRPRLLIAGYDLKFITAVVPHLEQIYDLRLDEWSGHDSHDEQASRAALDWADLIWCEWLLGNAVWYSRNKKPHQRLIVRMHRFELGRDFGDRMDVDRVDSVITVSTLFLERMLERFPNIPRYKARLQHNYIESAAYVKSHDPDRRFRLGMIGILPARKGFEKSLSILHKLRQHDPRYTLDIFGKAAQDLPWLMNNTEEATYFQSCAEKISNIGLEDAVKFHGHVDVCQELAAHNVGIILSLSASVRDFPCFESFHLAVADAFASGGVGLVRYWEGAEFIWPDRIILPSEEAIVDRILSYRSDFEAYLRDCDIGAKFIEERYNINKFISSMQDYFREKA
ncbi:Glycosyl transferase family 2 [Roseovarius lutimaris]|uniref:Glycosyl transferase family 2 n=1 Tax=Roseovarius lutimaris TaxID=1005928 RepID=A0A1I5GMW1_9RHOB|nr:glycosyltransferase [Roseovarius lutimaris]SFO37404.1 Glycosyl transferase family 2 [Roseovarius lutimaris]